MNDLIVDPHPLTTQGRVVVHAAAVYPRESLADFLERNGVATADGRWTVTIGGAEVPAAMWACTRPKAGQVILCRRVPGKSAIRVVAMIALVAFAFSTGGLGLLALSGLTAGTFAAVALQAGVVMLGSMIINKLLPPSRARLSSYDQQTGSTYSLQGGRNRARPYEPMGLLLGVTKVVPDFLAQPFTWFASDEQYQAVRLHAGINCGDIDELKIGVTPLASFADVIESRVGFPAGNTVLPFWSDVDTQAGALLEAPASPGAWVTRTSSLNAVMLVVDVVAQLYDVRSDGGMGTESLTIELERRLLPAGGWVPLQDAGAAVTLVSKSTKAVRRSFSSPMLPAGPYEVRVRKVTQDLSSTKKANTIEWATLKTYQEDPTLGHQNPQLALSIKASGQLSGVLDEVSWVASQLARPVWDGTAWVNEVTRNPGAHILLLARGIFDDDGRLLAGLGWPDSQIDLEGLKAFMLHCAAKGYVFDHWFDAPLSCIEMLEAIAAAGMGSISFDPGKLSVVWLADDQPREDVVSMGNIKKGSFRIDHTTSASADELEVSWFDRDAGWVNRSLRVLAPGVVTPRETARYAPLGVTTEAAALRVARLTMAQNIYQRKSVTWEMDLEYLGFRRYSVIALSHDLTRWGYSGRVQAASIAGDIVTLQLDDEVPFNPAATLRSIGLRIPGEVGYRVFDIEPFVGSSHVLTLADPWPSGVPVPGSNSANPAHDTLWIYDFAAAPGKRLRVTEIEPSPDLKGAKVTAVPEPDEFWDYMASGAYTAPPAPAAGVALAVSNISVTQRRLDVNYGEGTELSITFDAVGPFSSAQVWGGPDGEALALLGTTQVTRFGPWPVSRGGDYEIVVRPFDALGRPGAFAAYTHAVTLDDAPDVDWENLAGRPKLFRVVARGYSDTVAPVASGLYDAETGAEISGVAAGRSYLFTRLGRDGVVQFSRRYDVFGVGSSGGYSAADLAADLNACDASHIVVVRSDDEPQLYRLSAGLEAAMYRCGASRAVFGSPQFKSRSAYVLVGIGGCGEGNGAEVYNGDVDDDTNAWCDLAFYIQDGQLIVSGPSTPPRTLADHGYLGTLDATTDLSLVATGLALLAGNVARKVVGNNAWDSQVYSRDGYTGGALASAVAMDVSGAAMIGLNSDPTADASYASIDHAAYLASGTLEVYENGAPKGAFGSYAVGDVVAVQFDGYSVRYLKNGTVFYTSTVHPAVTTKFFFDSSFFNVVGVKNLRFVPQPPVADIDTPQLKDESATGLVTVTVAGPVSLSSSVPVPDNQTTVATVPVGPYAFPVRIRASATFKARVTAPSTKGNSILARICDLNTQTLGNPPMQAFGDVLANVTSFDKSGSLIYEQALAAGASAVIAFGGLNGNQVSPYGVSEARDVLLTVEVIKK